MKSLEAKVLQVKQLLGVLTDQEVANCVGTTHQTIGNYRLKWGIPPRYPGSRIHSHKALKDAVLRAAPGRSAKEIWQVVETDYGSVSLRMVHRFLARLVHEKKLKRVTKGSSVDWYYVVIK